MIRVIARPLRLVDPTAGGTTIIRLCEDRDDPSSSPARLAASTNMRRASMALRHPSSASRQAITARRQWNPRADSGHAPSRHSSASKLVAILRSSLPGILRKTGSGKTISVTTSSRCFTKSKQLSGCHPLVPDLVSLAIRFKRRAGPEEGLPTEQIEAVSSIIQRRVDANARRLATAAG